ncbi:MAG: sulfatase-like hydrolase/transferase [Ignavibacteriales bacterium]|nr:sulfatase-like hydrolase/transferase [Ignavibacteriales bacterium]
MKRREFVKAAGLIAAGTAGAHDLAFGKNFLNGLLSSEKKPNIIFILADDLGIGNVSCYGADNYKTPRIDKLAREGVRFTHAYTAPLCGPSRALILTGRYAFRTGAVNQDMTGLMKPSVETMMPKILKPAGYVTAMIGKWGQLPLAPADFDFDEYLMFTGSGIYWNTQAKGKTYSVNGKKVPLRDKEYLPDVMHNHVVDFVTKNHDKPFYLYYSLSHVHAEILPTPDSAPDSKDLYADNIAYMDKLVGKLIDELEHQKLREKTLIIFFGDNGTGGKYADHSTIGGRRLSGQKGSMLECGGLVPMIVNWPGTTPAGKVNTDLIDSTDFVPTFAELTGAKLPRENPIDGRSFLPQLRGEQGKLREWIFVELGNQWHVREQRWKLNGSGQLFDMSNAPFEEKLVPKSTKNQEAIAARKRLQAALNQLNPAGGILDDSDGSGRHANKAKVKGKKQQRQSKKNQDDEN